MDNGRLLRLTAEATRHHGVFTRKHALEAGFTRSAISRRVDNGTWDRPLPEVYLMPTSPATWERSVAIAVFGSGTGAVASHATAAHLWGLAKRPRIIEVTSPQRGRPDRVHVIHRSTDLTGDDLAEIHGIPGTSVARCLVDVGIPWGEGMAERCLSEAVRLGLTTDQRVAAALHRVARRGRNGVGPMRIVLANRLGWSNLTESQLEDEFVRIMRAAGVDLPAPQVNISKRGGRWIARVDFVYPDIKLIIELDGERYHKIKTHSAKIDASRTISFWRAIGFCDSPPGMSSPPRSTS